MPDLQAILTEHADAVWQTVYRLLDDEHDAGECYQQTFADALRIDSQKVRDWKAVLCRIATRRAMDLLRKRYRERTTFRELDVEPMLEHPPDAELMLSELRQSVREALARLPKQQAEAFWLRHVEQMQPQEIAQQLGLEAGHVRVLVHRAVAYLRQTLGSGYNATFAMGQRNES